MRRNQLHNNDASTHVPPLVTWQPTLAGRAKINGTLRMLNLCAHFAIEPYFRKNLLRHELQSQVLLRAPA